MICVIDIKNSNYWNDIVKSFQNYDIYYLSNYVRPFYTIGDGEPILLKYEEKDLKGIVVLMKRNIENSIYYDSVTPYGYGGWLMEGNLSISNLLKFKDEYFNYMKKNSIVDIFTRYHPVLENSNPLKDILNIIPVGKTVSMDLSSPETILLNMSTTCRNRVRKAKKNGIKVFHSKEFSLLLEFEKIYNETMKRVHSDTYYIFPSIFYKNMDEYLKENMEIFYATYENKIISMAIMLYANKQMHYHLGGTLSEYRNLASVNLIFYEAAIWGNSNGFKSLHLGGGLGGHEDELYRFKSNFNKKSNLLFSVGKDIFIPDEYNRLVQLKKENSQEFDLNNNYFPLYRSK